MLRKLKTHTAKNSSDRGGIDLLAILLDCYDLLNMTLGKSIYASKLNWTNIFLQILMLFLFSFLFKSLVLKASQKKKFIFFQFP